MKKIEIKNELIIKHFQTLEFNFLKKFLIEQK